MHGAATKTDKRRPWPPELWLRAVGRPVGTTLSCALEQITAARQPQRCWAFDVPPRPDAAGQLAIEVNAVATGILVDSMKHDAAAPK